MIDVDRFEEQLDLALTDELRSAIGLATAPAPVPARAPAKARSQHQKASTTRPPSVGNETVPSLLRAGRMQDADRLISERRAHAEQHGTPADRRDAALWATMQALRDGRAEDARAGSLTVRALSAETGDGRPDDRFWGQQFWIVLDWGDRDERHELLDVCRERAYGRSDLYWRARLALLCARMGRDDEATREFDSCVAQLGANRPAPDPETQLLITDLVETATLLRDPARGRSLQGPLGVPTARMIFDDRSYICKGASTRYQALVLTASRRWEDCDQAFQQAVDSNRASGALPLVARVLNDWGSSLTDRGDSRAWECLKESAELARRLHMTGAISGMPSR
ncbi:MAG: hypothetical protein M3159_03415 [Actinomycetota bacterium]|nr:hypothetical protein [Actinomycetota bacterium]